VYKPVGPRYLSGVNHPLPPFDPHMSRIITGLR
jgi:hypothetical protein